MITLGQVEMQSLRRGGLLVQVISSENTHRYYAVHTDPSGRACGLLEQVIVKTGMNLCQT